MRPFVDQGAREGDDWIDIPNTINQPQINPVKSTKYGLTLKLLIEYIKHVMMSYDINIIA